MVELKIKNYIKGNRLKHSLGVKEKMKYMLNKLNIEEKRKKNLLISSELHDIGYSNKIKITGFHPLDGYTYLKNQLSLEIILPILMHSSAIELVKYENNNIMKIYTRKILNIKNYINKFDIDILSYCDATTNSKGENVSLEERYKDISNRYGFLNYRSIIFKNYIIYYRNKFEN